MATTPATATTRLDRAWKAQHEGGPLPARLREHLERALNADLSAVRVHTGPAADEAARAFDADAVACGSALFFRRGAFDPCSREGLHLLAHEVAHTVQQADTTTYASGLTCVSDLEDKSESMADRFADAFTAAYADGPSAVDGSLAALALPHGGSGRDVLRVAFGPSGVVQLHASFEHRYLGDGNPDDLRIIAENRDKVVRDRLIQSQLTLFELFDRKDPQNVTRADILRVAPHIQTMELGPDKILATLGEVNALPDYLSHPDQVDAIRGDVLLPILQVIRQEGYNEFHALLDDRNPYKRFPLSPFQPTGALWGIVGALRETGALDVLTAGLGIGGQDHYQGLLARNACHFAPYTWYRWLTFHLAARQAAADAYKAGGDAKLVRKAWNLAGYADHFLEDSFAAGHLIDKTLVMQWFVDWAADTDLVADQSVLRYMTAALQPGLAAGKLYDATYNGPSHDPQTVQELRTEAERILGTRLRPGREDGQLAGYLDYLTFLTSAAAQLGTNLLHNHYNDNSLWVASTANPTPYRVWGDGTLLSGRDAGVGAYITASAAQLSRRAVQELITKGGTSVTPAEIRDAFPTVVGPSPDKMTTIQRWATEQRPFVEETIFKGFEGEIGKLLTRLSSPRLGIVSRDEALGEQFATRTDTEDSIIHAESAVLPVGERLFAASRGYVFELDPVSGAPLKGRMVELPDVFGSTISSLASNGRMLFIGISAHVHALPVDGPWDKHSGWTSREIGGPANLRLVTLLMERDRLFAASHGYVYQLDPDTGAKLQEVELGSKVGFGDYPVDLTTDGELLYAGTHGYVYAMSLREKWDGPLWYSAKLGAGIDHEPVSVLVKDGQLFALSDGEAYELPRDGSKHIIQHIDLKSGRLSPYRASLATDEGMLYIGTHGAAYALPLHTKWEAAPAWTTEALTNFGEHGPVSVLYLRDRLFVGCGGYVYELDLLDGATRQQWQLTYLISTILDMPSEMAASHSELYIGVHGYAYGMLLADIQPTPTGAWPLTQTGGTTVPDRRGIHPATAANVNWRPVPGLGGCAEFNGRNSSISTALPVLDTTPDQGFTVDAWVRLDALPAAGTSAIVSQAGEHVSAFTLGYSRDAMSWMFELAGSDGQNPKIHRLAARTEVIPGLWTRVSGVYDPDATNAFGAKTAELRIYVNSTFAARLDLSAPTGFAAHGPLLMGVSKLADRPDCWLNGAVRDVRVYGEALDNLRLEPRAAAFWRLDEHEGRVAKDRRRHHDATVHGVTWTYLPDVGRCAVLNGRDSTITPNAPVVDAGRGGSFTVAAWARQDAAPTITSILLGQNAQRVPAFFIDSEMTSATTSSWTFARYPADSENGDPIRAKSNVNIRLQTWAHVAGVYDAASSTMHIYINGVRCNSTPFPRDRAFDASGAFTIGYGTFAGVNGGRLEGSVRDVRAYDQALSDSQIKNLLDDTGIRINPED